MQNKKKYFAQPQPDGDGHQVSYETGGSRRVRRFPKNESKPEPKPHGAGSYHDPDHHHELVERVETYLRGQA